MSSRRASAYAAMSLLRRGGATGTVTGVLRPARRIYCAVMSSPVLTVTFEANEPARLARFWARLLGREVVGDPSGSDLPGADGQVDLRFVLSRSTREGPNLLHLHLTSA